NNFDGDRVLANSILFLQDFGWWTEIAYAVPEGDIGRVFEILKIWIFTFAGSTHQNYTTYLLEVYCLLRYEASQDLRDGILNNWLVNVTGELGRWIEADLLQEHYNRWLEDMVKKRGGDFDDDFYRHTLSPNVDHFLRIKEEIENAFTLRSRGKTHTSPHLRDELRILLALFKEEKLHLFCSGRTLGHAAINQFNEGHERLDMGKLDDFICKSTAYADVIGEIQAYKQVEKDSEANQPQPGHPGFEVLSPHINDSSDDTNTSASEPTMPANSSSSESDSIRSLSPSSSSSSSPSIGDNDNDPSDAHLVSGSDYDFYLLDNQLTHATWYEQECEEDADNSSDEDESSRDVDCSFNSDSDNGVEDEGLFNFEDTTCG
ncbi:hypothetical protein K443DRAFT_154869, partial [Laccaria amethystina LaAM-08-1]